MTSKTTLRTLVVAEAVLATATIMIGEIQGRIGEVVDIQPSADFSSLRFLVGAGLGGVSVIGVVVGWIGLWLFWRPSRAIYTISWLGGLISTYGVMGLDSTETAMEALTGDLATLIAGCILGVIHTSDLACLFQRKEAEASASNGR